MFLRNLSTSQIIVKGLNLSKFNLIRINKFSTNLTVTYTSDSNISDDNNINDRNNNENNGNGNINRTELLTQLINLYESNNTNNTSIPTKPNLLKTEKTLLYTNWEFLEACYNNNSFVALDKELTKLYKVCRTDLRLVFIKFGQILESLEQVDEDKSNSLTIIIDHFINYLVIKNPHFLNTIGLKITNMSNFYHLINQYSPQSTKLSSKLKLTQIFLNYFESIRDLEGLTKIYNNLEDLDKLINNTTTRTNSKRIRSNNSKLNAIRYQLMTSLIGLDNQLSLQILNQSWYSYNHRKSTLQNPLDFIVQYCLQTTSSTLKLTKQERISRLEILFPLYDVVEEFIKLRPNTLSRYNAEIQKILVGMGHYFGLSNNIDGLINFLNTKRLVQPNHYVYSTLIHNTMKLGFPPIAAKIFNQFMDTRLNTPPTASNNAPYASLIHGFAVNKQWDALANYFDLRLNLPLKLSAKLYDDIIFSFKENTPPLQLIQTIYYQMLKVDNLRPSIGSLDVIVKLLSSYQLDGYQNQALINPLSLRLNSYYNLVTSSNLELDTRFFNTMIHQLVTNTTTQDLESITQLLSNLYKDLIEKDLQPNVQFLTTMLIVYLKLGRKEGVMEILGFLNSKPELMDKKLVYLLKKML